MSFRFNYPLLIRRTLVDVEDGHEECRWSEKEEIGLVASAKSGDLASFDALAAKYRPALLAIARQISDPDHAEDAVQDSLIAAYKALPRLADDSRFAAWVGAIVRNRAKRLVRDSTKTVCLDELIVAYAPSIVRDLENQSVADEVVQAIATLDDDVRLVAQLHYVQRMPTRQISQILSLPLTTVKWRLHTGRRTLQKRLCQSLENSNEE